MTAKTQRNLQMVSEYLAGDSLSQIGRRYGVTPGRVSHILKRHGARLSPEELRERIARVNRLKAGHNCGRPRIFPNDPVKRKHYVKLRNIFGAAYAREAMGVPRLLKERAQ